MSEQKKSYIVNRWIEGPFRLSHHPLCSPFGDHTLPLFGKNVCRGCLFWYPGIVLGLITGLILGIYNINEWILAVLMIVLITPTLLSVIFNLPRQLKDLSRGFLGLSTGFAILIIFFPGQQLWYVRIIVLAIFLSISIFFR